MTANSTNPASPPNVSQPPWLRETRARSAIAAELHGRRALPVAAPTRVRRATFLGAAPDRSDLDALHKAIATLAARDHTAEPKGFSRQIEYTRGTYQVVFELHNEFVTLTWYSSIDDRAVWPQEIGLDLFAEFSMLTATRVDVTITDVISPTALGTFQQASLCYSSIYGGQAQVATDFVRDADCFTHYEFSAGRCGPLRAGVIVRRLLEIETYSNLVLLGLPLARQYAPEITATEVSLGDDAVRVEGDVTTVGNRSALDKLHMLSMSVGQIVEATSFRFAASRAYGEVLRTRMQRLEEVSIGEFTAIQRYLSNRIEPALATCRATEKRLDRLAVKIQRSIELLDARINLSLQTQNQSVLDTIAKTALSQYRLQKTVEGLSTIAISYYSLAILGYVFDGLHQAMPISKSVALLISAPFVLLGVWLGLRRIHRLH